MMALRERGYTPDLSGCTQRPEEKEVGEDGRGF